MTHPVEPWGSQWDGVKGIYRIWANVRWPNGRSRKQGFALDWILSISRSNSVIGCLNNSCLEGRKNTVVPNLELVRKPKISQKRGVSDHFLVWKMFLFFCVCSDKVTEWPCLILIFSEIVYIQNKVLWALLHSSECQAKPAPAV